MALTTAAPYLALLNENDPELKSYALQAIDPLVDSLWAEIANDITKIEELYEEESFKDRKLAALVAAKLYYQLGDYESSVMFALVAGDEFKIDSSSEFIETIVSKSIDQYIELQSENYAGADHEIDPALLNVFEKMLSKCIKAGEFKLALGIALESFRLDAAESILKERLAVEGEDAALNLFNYVLTAATTVVSSTPFRAAILNCLFEILIQFKTHPDYFMITKIIVNLNDEKLAARLFDRLITDSENTLVAYQVAFDLVSSASQGLLDSLLVHLQGSDPQLLKILSGIPTCDYGITFLNRNNNTDVSILNKTKAALDGRISLFHNAVSIQNAFCHAGTTDDSFFRSNLSWLGKASNWSKFSATAALGVIHKGNLSQGLTILKPYLPTNSTHGSRYTKGGSLYGLGLIFAGHGREITSYLRDVIGNANTSADDDEVLLHGGALGLGVAAMGSANADIYEELKTILFSDSAVSGEAAGYAIGLVMLGTGNAEISLELLHYANETQHETIIRGIAVGLSLIHYGREELADGIINEMLNHENALLRYGSAQTIAMAYAGTGNNKAVKKLLHIAVSDSSDDVRRAAVTGLGFVLIREYTTVPRIVELLSESYNPHVRYGTAMALGISCASRGLQTAVEVLMPLTKDPVDFVKQGAMVALSMILMQQTEKTNPVVKQVKELFSTVATAKGHEPMAKFGAAISQGIIDAGGRNVTIQLENSQTGTLDTKAIVGLAMFTQYWYWFPLTHFLSLSFTPTSVIGVRASDLAIPNFELNCHTKPTVFSYPPKVEESTEKQTEKVATAVLSITKKAKARAKKSKKDKMDIDEPEPVAESTAETTAQTDATAPAEAEEDNTIKYVQKPYKLQNATRVVPLQLKYISFNKDDRYVPVRKFKGNNGVVVLNDTKPQEPADIIKTVRQLADKDAPLPKPFTVTEDLTYEG